MQYADGSGVSWNSWLANQKDDPYGVAIFAYAERWANLMETRMSDGSRLEDIAQQASHDADTDGITGFMYGAAVATLSKTWAHGEELRRWHNKDVQISSEGEDANDKGGVLNPSILVARG